MGTRLHYRGHLIVNILEMRSWRNLQTGRTALNRKTRAVNITTVLDNDQTVALLGKPLANAGGRDHSDPLLSRRLPHRLATLLTLEGELTVLAGDGGRTHA